MNCDELQQLTAIAALGALDEADAARLREHLERDPAAAAELARFMDVAGALAAALPSRKPSVSVRGRVLERIRRVPQRRSGTARGHEPAAGTFPLPEAIQFITHDAPWLPAPLPGARLKVLSAGPNQAHAILLVDLPPGAIYPEHDHVGTEDTYVLTGDLQTEGRSLGPGDFLHAEPGSHHQPLRSVGGCMALMVVPIDVVREMIPG